jgi:hypothetical protein
MGVAWQVEVNPDVTVNCDGSRCVIGGVVSVAFDLDEVEFVWTESAEGSVDPPGLLKVRLRDRSGTIAQIRLRRGEAQQVRTMLERGGPLRH